MDTGAGNSSINLMIGGEAGQGLATVGQILAKSLVRAGYFIAVTQSYHSRIRGGHNTFAIRTGVSEVLGPAEPVDLLVALNEETVSLHQSEMSGPGIILADAGLNIGEGVHPVPYSELAEGMFVNIAALGIMGSLLGLDRGLVQKAMEDFFGKKGIDAEKNLGALGAGYKWAAGLDAPGLRLPEPAEAASRWMINGNEAIAFGALSAGVRFVSFYPMTPATSIVLNIIAHAEGMDVVVEQAEDEIAAINMALGASFAGAVAMTATSGGGFALMTEGLSLAGMTETPVVVALAQRPGPATGLPTRTAQEDLLFVLHGGHGEFPKAIFAPGTVEECFHLTRRAFDMANRYQTTAFILTDQFLADSFRAVDPFDVEGLGVTVPREAASCPPGYLRYAISKDGISPRMIPGECEPVVLADSDEHTERGNITEDLSIRIDMVNKRLKKGDGLREEFLAPSYNGVVENPEVLLVSWGSSRGAVKEASLRIAAGGVAAATLHFSQVWPLKPELFMDRLKSAKSAVMVEGNATGQFAGLITRETGFRFDRLVLRYDGLPLTPEYILRELG